jgi:hypothetical protein
MMQGWTMTGTGIAAVICLVAIPLGWPLVVWMERRERKKYERH